MDAYNQARHEHSNLFEVYPGEDSKIRFHMEDGSYITVHVRDGELRACGSGSLVASNRHHDVLAINMKEGV